MLSREIQCHTAFSARLRHYVSPKLGTKVFDSPTHPVKVRFIAPKSSHNKSLNLCWQYVQSFQLQAVSLSTSIGILKFNFPDSADVVAILRRKGVIVDEITAAIDYQFALVLLNTLHVVRRMAMNDIDSARVN